MRSELAGAANEVSATTKQAQTLSEKIWEQHVVHRTERRPERARSAEGGATISDEGAPDLLYIDLHLVHEVTSAQAFEGLRLAGRPVRRPDRTLATADHNVPTDGTPVAARIRDELSRVQVEALEANCAEFGVPVYSMGSDRQDRRGAGILGTT